MRDRGAALLVVILGLALAAAAAGAILLTARAEVSETRLHLEAARARALAAAGVEIAAARLLADEAPPRAFKTKLDGVELAIAVEDEAGKVDVNEAEPELIEAALRAAGLKTSEAARLADAIADWRDADDERRPQGAEAAEYRGKGRPPPRDRPFRTLDELRGVLGFPPEVLPALRRFATAHSQLRGLDPREAAPELLKLIPSERAFMRSHRLAYRVLSTAALPSGVRFRRDAVIWLTPGEAEPFARLAWGEARW
jgi:general secretion pathway protein K